jgi:hypothetical protein
VLLASRTSPQLPVPVVFVNRSRLFAFGQQLQSVVVVVAVVEVVVVAVVAVVAVVDVVVVAVVAVVDVVAVVAVVDVVAVVAVVDVVAVVAVVDVVAVVAVVDVVAVVAVVDVVAVVAVVAVVDVVVVDDVVLVVGPGHTQPARQSSIAPPGDPDGQVALPGGSHCSPASTTPLPHTGPWVLVVVAVVVVVVCVVAVVEVVDVVVVDDVVLVVGTDGQMQPARQSSIAPPGDPDGQVALPGGSHCSPASTCPLPHTGPCMVVVVVWVVDVVVVAVVGGVLVVVLEDTTQPLGPHASQQLGRSVTQAVPPLTGLHAAAFFRRAQRERPCASVMQQVTTPSLPHVDFEAHLMMESKHSFRSVPPLTAPFATRETHITYFPWLSAPAQSHCSSAAARTAAISPRSRGSSLQGRD